MPFADLIERDELLEYAIVYGDYKGIPKKQVQDALDSGNDVVLRIDVQGAATIRKMISRSDNYFPDGPHRRGIGKEIA